MATPPREGWDGDKGLAGERTSAAKESGFDSWHAWVEAVEAESRYDSICGRKNSRGSPCEQAEGQGTGGRGGACKYHGGRSLRGAASPSYKTGEHVQAHERLRGLVDRYRGFDDWEVFDLVVSAHLDDVAELLEALQREGASAEGGARALDILNSIRGADDPRDVVRLMDVLERTLESRAMRAEIRERLREALTGLRMAARDRQAALDSRDLKMDVEEVIGLMGQFSRLVLRELEALGDSGAAQRVRRRVIEVAYSEVGIGRPAGDLEAEDRPGRNGKK